jgi:hypothetical protein
VAAGHFAAMLSTNYFGGFHHVSRPRVISQTLPNSQNCIFRGRCKLTEVIEIIDKIHIEAQALLNPSLLQDNL